MEDQIFITRNGERFGPYTHEQCDQMLTTGQLVQADMAWRNGMPDWRPLGEVFQPVLRMAVPQPMMMPPRQAIVMAPQESAGEIVGKMGCGCIVWIGLLALALGGGVVFPVLLIVLPFVVIGGIIDMVKKLSRLSKQRDQNRQF